MIEFGKWENGEKTCCLCLIINLFFFMVALLLLICWDINTRVMCEITTQTHFFFTLLRMMLSTYVISKEHQFRQTQLNSM